MTMNRKGLSSFQKIFGESPALTTDGGSKPSVHELFAMAMRGQLPLDQFADALDVFHGVPLTPAAAKLLTSLDADSCHLTFAQFQRALQDTSGLVDGPDKGAGLPYVLQDQAKAIITDNSGQPVAPPALQGQPKHFTDISVDSHTKQVREAAMQARGPFSGNPVVATNRPSAGNPLVARLHEEGPPGEDFGCRAMASTAARMVISGELDKSGLKKMLASYGVEPDREAEVWRLVSSHEQAGGVPFLALQRSIHKELQKAGLT